MPWSSGGYSSGPIFSSQSGKTMRSMSLTSGIFDLNMNEPIINNTWCPIVTDPTPAEVLSPKI